MVKRVDKVNTSILLECRQQIGLSLDEVSKKIPKIKEIETGEQKPTFKQLDVLAELYKVPRWVFISDELPNQYQFNKSVPAFRQFVNSNTNIFSDYKIRSLLTKINQYRELIIKLQDDMNEPIESFEPPTIQSNASADMVANEIRKWLKISENLTFLQWKEILESKGVFIFMTSKYKGWSHITKEILRGLAIYHSKLPIIIINDSDFKKAQSFTLFHELGHLLRKENAIDNWNYQNRNIEKWCDEFAGNVLIPATQLQIQQDIVDLDFVKSIAKKFKVSYYACLVRLRQLEIIDQSIYINLETQLKHEYIDIQKKNKNKKGGPVRNRAKEILNQYGHIYTTVLFQAYHNKEIGLHRLSRLFDLKKISVVFEIERIL